MHKDIETEIDIDDIKLEITGTYYPEEPMVRYDDNMEGYPGAPAEFEIESVKLLGVDIIDILSDEVYEKIIEKVIENQN